MIDRKECLYPFDFTSELTKGLLVCAGGFEDRSLAFARRLRKRNINIEESVILQYESQREDNDTNFRELEYLLEKVTGKKPNVTPVNANTPLESCLAIKTVIEETAPGLRDYTALVDISGMTNLWALSSIHAVLRCGLDCSVIYTEARWYYPPKREQNRIVRAWKERRYDIASRYLQSSGLKAVNIPPEFVGNFRPGKQTCLIVFVGYEPNRAEGLIDDYAPGALIVLYGRSPHSQMYWRTQLSRDLHEELFSQWHIRESEISTLLPDKILEELESSFDILKEQYDIAIAPQCSKMQAVASYIFWRNHPEVQLLFTLPVRFNPNRYSKGSRTTYVYDLSSSIMRFSEYPPTP